SATPLTVVGIQVFFWPNPVDRPMWSQGVEDFRRVIAFELALATELEDIGPADRFTGPLDGDFPPVLVGGALHLLPYTTVSAGMVVLGSRRSPLPQERSQTIVSPYVAASVELNVPDLVMAITGRETTAK